MTNMKFGHVQYRIMKVLWAKERANAREITDMLNETKPIAHSTVQTLLRKLEEKRAVDHIREDRTFIFFPLVKAEEATRSAVREIVDRIFSGSPKELVSYLLKNEPIDENEIRDIRGMIDAADRKSTKK